MEISKSEIWICFYLSNIIAKNIGQQSQILRGAGGFNGGIDDVYIYNRQLDADEIKELYAK